MKCPRCDGLGSGCLVCAGSGDVFPHQGKLPWLEPRIILYHVHGSRAYGTNRPDSDYDFKGVVIPPAVYRDGFCHNFEQAEVKTPVDATVFGLKKFMALAADCNPNIIESLFVDESDLLICTSIGRKLLDSRELFLSKKALGTFRGYAMSQLARIKTHRKWLLDPPKAAPTREEFGLGPKGAEMAHGQVLAALDMVKKQVDSWSIDFGDLSEATKIYIQEQIHQYLAEVQVGSQEKFFAAGRMLGFQENFLEFLNKEGRFKVALQNWTNFQTWRSERNAARAQLEAQYGFDTKHGMHLVRLLRMCREILVDGSVHVRRPDAQELLAIRNGAWTYDQLMAWAEEQNAELVQIGLGSKLQEKPNYKKLDLLCRELTAMAADEWDTWTP